MSRLTRLKEVIDLSNDSIFYMNFIASNKEPGPTGLPIHPPLPLTTVMCAIEVFRRDKAQTETLRVVIAASIGTIFKCSDTLFMQYYLIVGPDPHLY